MTKPKNVILCEEAAKYAANALSSSLLWDRTKEGREFWEDVIGRVLEITRDGYRLVEEKSFAQVMRSYERPTRDPKVEALHKGAHCLMWGFNWATTEEGHEFWAAIHKRMLQLSEQPFGFREAQNWPTPTDPPPPPVLTFDESTPIRRRRRRKLK